MSHRMGQDLKFTFPQTGGPNMSKVLLADDEIPYLLAVGDFLEDEGYTVEKAANAAEVLGKAPAADVLVIDARLPSSEYEGVVSIGDLLRQRQIRASVPILFISIDSETTEGAAAVLQRCRIPSDRYRWLIKPFEL